MLSTKAYISLNQLLSMASYTHYRHYAIHWLIPQLTKTSYLWNHDIKRCSQLTSKAVQKKILPLWGIKPNHNTVPRLTSLTFYVLQPFLLRIKVNLSSLTSFSFLAFGCDCLVGFPCFDLPPFNSFLPGILQSSRKRELSFNLHE